LGYAPRSVHSGYSIAGNRVYSPESYAAQYVELGTSGLLFCELQLDELLIEGVNEEHVASQWHGLNPLLVLSQIDGLLKFAALDEIRRRPIDQILQVHVSLHQIQGAMIRASNLVSNSELERHTSPSPDIILLHETVRSSGLEDIRLELLKRVTISMLWAFGYDWTQDHFDQYFSDYVLS
jgi:hypothetical protein